MIEKKTLTKKPQQLIGIQYLRAIAVIFVVLDHATGMSRLPKYFGLNFKIFNNFFQAGAVGVDLFFVISGFIIVYASLNDITLTSTISFPVFFKQRFIRIIPFLWVCILATIILRLLGRGTFPFWDYLRSLTLFPVGEVEPRLVWTLRNEFLFYVLFGLFIIYWKNKWNWLILWFISPFIWYTVNLLHAVRIDVLKDLGNFLFNIHNVDFGIGVLIAIIYKKHLFPHKIKFNISFLVLLIICVPLLILAYNLGMENASNNFVQLFFCAIYSAMVVQIGIFIHTDSYQNYLNRIGIIIGNASYSIYLTHSAIMSALLGFLSKYYSNINSVLLLFLVASSSLIFGVLTYLFVEKPLINKIKSQI